jgi:hypothetical protein
VFFPSGSVITIQVSVKKDRTAETQRAQRKKGKESEKETDWHNDILARMF